MGNPIKLDVVDVNIMKSGAAIHRSFSYRSIGEGDLNGDAYGVNVVKNGEPADLTGCSCIGYFIRPDGNTIVIPGNISGNTAYVIVPEECYVYVGSFTLSIKITGSGFAGTMRIVDGTIVDTSTQTLIDPGHVIPDLSAWIALISDANDAVTDIGKIHLESELITGTRYKMKVYKDS